MEEIKWSKYRWFPFSKGRPQERSISKESPDISLTHADPTTAFFDGYDGRVLPETRLQKQIALHQLREKRSLEAVSALKAQPKKKVSDIDETDNDFHLSKYILPACGAMAALSVSFILVRLGRGQRIIAPDGLGVFF